MSLKSFGHKEGFPRTIKLYIMHRNKIVESSWKRHYLGIRLKNALSRNLVRKDPILISG